ncbi:tRNA (adenosine(37)-N6)-dimethylallyltransferase MiaA [Convivina praedatoris]|uniref:tRNA dimethylallyltransferase n=1 Tax=Convivina praedatoris TaxID=2880963 RepID=A0ABN8HDV4_9LACO|nr:tRNA (adenosine(37)-N6)-dimethylallyltransferase MiaA [Convivina sp. LMG 32447]CAH1854021.1 tRNA dimethylallyltransferase [Convivina sp. LMG 32447]CAH1855306.1 tRNA dimethylallyltransferase [Convivina sp. LMG 32447]CAH1855383.1 tRNA dimethylallyltransferase [Convivina sp. LMG 32447]
MVAIPILVIAGPTASGKSSLALKVAEEFNGEIISADSMQIYRGLDIGTAKPTVAEQDQICHHLIDIVDINQKFSVHDYIRLADQAILSVHRRGKLPIVVGGTGFYVKSLLGLQSLEYGESNLDEVAELEKLTTVELRDLLIDSTLVTDRDNRQRLIRGIQKQQHGKKTSPVRPIYDAQTIALAWPRDILYERINQRVLLMLEQGLIDEAQMLYNTGGIALQAGRGIGYKEFYPYFNGQVTLNEVVEQIQQDSRRYAKRQLTYWRHQIDGLEWVDAGMAYEHIRTYLAD